jgi:endonuclease G
MIRAFLHIFFILAATALSHGQDLSPNGEFDNIINHSYFKLSYSEDHEQAEWVIYTLEGRSLNPSISRTNNFRPDPKVNSGSAQLDDYKGSGFDRGHLVPAADMKYSNLSMSESFYMSNISPQYPSFNRQIWKKIEKQFRDWSYEYGAIVVVTGPVLNGDFIGYIGENRVAVPRYFYKVAIDPNNLERNIAILIENKGSKESIQNFVISIDELESYTGIDFFYKLDDSLEARIEGVTHDDLWNWSIGSPIRNNSPTTLPTIISEPSPTTLPTIISEPSASEQLEKGNIFITKTGKKYHRGSCRYLSRSMIPITLKSAQRRGFNPCSVCKP